MCPPKYNPFPNIHETTTEEAITNNKKENKSTEDAYNYKFDYDMK